MTFQEYGREMLERRLKQLNKMMSLNAPDNVLSLEICMLWQAAEIAFGEELYAEKLRQQQGYNRQYIAFCQHCDNEINPQLSHAPICEYCEARFDAEAERLKDYL